MPLESRGGGVVSRFVETGSVSVTHLSAGAPLTRVLGLMLFCDPVIPDLTSFTGTHFRAAVGVAPRLPAWVRWGAASPTVGGFVTCWCEVVAELSPDLRGANHLHVRLMRGPQAVEVGGTL